MNDITKKRERIEIIRVGSGLLAEVLFVIAPLLVIYLVSLVNNHGNKVLASPEWSVGSIILFGQAMVKFVLSVAQRKFVAAGPLALVFVLLVMAGLLPACFLLVHVTSINEGVIASPAGSTTLSWINTAQVILFVVAIIVYLSLGLLSDLLIKERGNPVERTARL